jgi:stalled ribosome rescue protein Dom34
VLRIAEKGDAIMATRRAENKEGKKQPRIRARVTVRVLFEKLEVQKEDK